MQRLWLNLDWTNRFLEAQGQLPLSCQHPWEPVALEIQHRIISLLADVGYQEQVGHGGDAGLWAPLVRWVEGEDLWIDERVLRSMTYDFALIGADASIRTLVADALHELWTAVRCVPGDEAWTGNFGRIEARDRILGIEVQAPPGPLKGFDDFPDELDDLSEASSAPVMAGAGGSGTLH